MVGQELAHAEQPTLEGLEPRKPRRRSVQAKLPAEHNPIASIVLDMQASHLGQTFDYLIERKQSDRIQPGVLVRVRFGGRLVNGVVWSRSDSSTAERSSLRYVERVLSNGVLVPEDMRHDISRIAEAYGGTRANILRLAVPPRVAHVDKELAPLLAAGSEDADGPKQAKLAWPNGVQPMPSRYEGVDALRDALHSSQFRSFVVDALPGVGGWCADVAWMMLAALQSGRSSLIVLPSQGAIDALARTLTSLGVTLTGQLGADGQAATALGDVAVLTTSMTPAERYRAYLAVSSGLVRCVVGTRAAMYAPVHGSALFVVVDDGVYQYADGMMPYANVRGVMRLRAHEHGGVFVAFCHARSVLSEQEVSQSDLNDEEVSGPSGVICPTDAAVREELPWVRWLNRSALAELGDPTVGSRVPHTAVSVLTRAMTRGPVLLTIPRDDGVDALCCASCHRLARCRRCGGPLRAVEDGRLQGHERFHRPTIDDAAQTTRFAGGLHHSPSCMWCGVAAVNWTCPECSGSQVRTVRVGAAGTARELSDLFRAQRFVLSSRKQSGGAVHRVKDVPGTVVIASADAIPLVMDEHGAARGYASVAVLDAWTSLYTPGIDARIDTLRVWMHIASWCKPRADGGQVLIVGESDPLIVNSLMLFKPSLLASAELAERVQTGMPPVCSCARVWGQRTAVMSLLQSVGAIDGRLAVFHSQAGDMPAMLGPVPIPQPDTVDVHELEATRDSVRALVRVERSQRGELVRRLQVGLSRHVASRAPGRLRFQIDPKDLI